MGPKDSELLTRYREEEERQKALLALIKNRDSHGKIMKAIDEIGLAKHKVATSRVNPAKAYKLGLPPDTEF